jgi:hypothetical protein
LHYDMCSPGGSHDPKVVMVQQAVFHGVGPGRVLEIAEAGFRIFAKLASAGGGKAVLPNPMVYVNGLLPGPGRVLATKFSTFTITSTEIGDEGMVSQNLCQRLAEALLRVDACDVATCLAVGPLRKRVYIHFATLEAALGVINFFQLYGRHFAPLLGGRMTIFTLETEAATARMDQGSTTLGREWDIPPLQQVIAEVSPGPPMEMGDDEADLLLQRQRGRADEALLVDANWTLEAEGLYVHPDRTIRVRRYAGGGWRLELAWAMTQVPGLEGYCAIMAVEESESQNPRAFSLVRLCGALQGLLQHPQASEVLSASCIGALQETLELAEANLPKGPIPVISPGVSISGEEVVRLLGVDYALVSAPGGEGWVTPCCCNPERGFPTLSIEDMAIALDYRSNNRVFLATPGHCEMRPWREGKASMLEGLRALGELQLVSAPTPDMELILGGIMRGTFFPDSVSPLQ